MNVSMTGAAGAAPMRATTATPPPTQAGPATALAVDGDGDHDGDMGRTITAAAVGNPGVAAAVQARLAEAMTG